MKNKRTAMAFSALLILIFHLWIPLFPGNEPENFIKQVSYIGVDMFFFLSGWSLAIRPITDPKAFLISRFRAIYLKFALLAVVACVYSGWPLSRLLRVVTGVELFTKGGGAFLWFLPAIMLFYIGFAFWPQILAPVVHFQPRVPATMAQDEPGVPILTAQDKPRVPALTIKLGTILMWAVPALLLTWCTNYTQIVIVWNRIPIFLLGYHLCRSNFGQDLMKDLRRQTIWGAGLTLVGLVLLYFFGYRLRLQIPITDMFYVTAIPAGVGLVLLVSRIPERRILRAMGSATLEMYGIQMIFGFKLANRILKITGNKSLTNLVVFSLIILISVGVQRGYHFLETKVMSVWRSRRS